MTTKLQLLIANLVVRGIAILVWHAASDMRDTPLRTKRIKFLDACDSCVEQIDQQLKILDR